MALHLRLATVLPGRVLAPNQYSARSLCQGLKRLSVHTDVPSRQSSTAAAANKEGEAELYEPPFPGGGGTDFSSPTSFRPKRNIPKPLRGPKGFPPQDQAAQWAQEAATLPHQVWGRARARSGLLAMKVGMLPVWDKWGVRYPCTILQVDNCAVVQVKTEDHDGYDALQLTVGEAKHPQRALQGHYARHKLDTTGRKLGEFRVRPEALIPVGTKIHAQHFVAGQLVDVCGITKGKGTQGAMKKHGFKGGPASHGCSKAHRSLGSTGQCQDPGRVFKGKKMHGKMGNDRVTTSNLKIMKIEPARNLLFVHGCVPGNKGGFVRVRDAIKGPKFPSPPPFPTFVPGEEAEYPDEILAPAGDVDLLEPVQEPEVQVKG
uniref:Large ribosomal subunit protein uL3m n=1 Tax=Fibrocapsa japonica TaxID=94617 RepID=A0A7S2V0H5_9STRA|mmetsp:Transcript_18420/g.26777  ORF Transcript_18420/g.26777 Transcript_18420/m.26777 type:complete len:374 (+) Transcript_18420:162-1283(+)|eukprot:CAMPEP_0113935048 /NCGR_PEP_ID=MMETSP1339-20121228/2279_1 /TAXON_ID=94617 /ORGANISM="Fibrocapsa japonica" /LENGTH=373 /DNA_ID=CAMNT_0000937061 /DNA_START=92 /DNA_END=1213 /DNA_ORIENTATION=- /assembly_acc=CAM_ASM_000762